MNRAKQVSAGLLMYRFKNNTLEVCLMHPGGPFFVKKDEGFWSLPKGLIEDGEDPQKAAMREFEEEAGVKPKNELIPLGSIIYKSGKTVHAWAFENNDDDIEFKSNLFELEWPPKSGKIQKFPEADKVEFLPTEIAKKKITQNQVEFIKRLEDYLKEKS
jgi:predicted NUDIX family NTP pyrophosphohydrolase